MPYHTSFCCSGRKKGKKKKKKKKNLNSVCYYKASSSRYWPIWKKRQSNNVNGLNTIYNISKAQGLIKTTIHFLKSEVEERKGTGELWEADMLLMGTIWLFSCVKSVCKLFFSHSNMMPVRAQKVGLLILMLPFQISFNAFPFKSENSNNNRIGPNRIFPLKMRRGRKSRSSSISGPRCRPHVCAEH